jgi:hypothetical protein
VAESSATNDRRDAGGIVHDCRDTGGRATQEQLPREAHHSGMTSAFPLAALFHFRDLMRLLSIHVFA